MWGQLGAGACLTARAYQVYVASVLSFVGQLEPLPDDFDAAEEKACAALFPGPTDWITAGGLTDLRSLGCPWELRDVRAATIASKARVVRFEAQGNLQVHARARRMGALLSNVDSTLAREAWLGMWRPRCFLLQLACADIQVSQMICQRLICASKNDWAGSAELRWSVGGLPGHMRSAISGAGWIAGRSPLSLAADQLGHSDTYNNWRVTAIPG